MVSKRSPEKLPDGWSVQFNILKTGRKIKYYLNHATGQKSFSKEDVFRHSLRTSRLDHSRATKVPVERHPKDNQMQLANGENKILEWLPNGWIMETKRTGNGRSYKCYVDPSTNRKFYSKPEVLQYLGNQKHKSCSSKQRNIKKTLPPTGKLANGENNILEWLPDHWIVEVRPRKGYGNRSYKCYVNPSTNRKFYSKPEVLQYLRSQKRKNCASKQGNTQKSLHPAGKVSITLNHSKLLYTNGTVPNPAPKNQVIIEKSIVEDLPSGWVKEVRIRRAKATNKIRRIPYYIDPVSGYVFRCKVEVQRYLETGEISKHAWKRRIEDIDSSFTTKRQKLAKSADKQQLLTGKGDADVDNITHSGIKASTKGSGENVFIETMVPMAPIAEIPSQTHSKDKLIDKAAASKENSSASLSTLPPEAKVASKTVAEEEVTNNGHAFSPVSGTMVENDLLECEIKRSSKHKAQCSSRKPKYRKLTTLPCRSSKRLQLDPKPADISSLGSSPSQKVAKSSGSESKIDARFSSDCSASKASEKLAVEQKLEFPCRAFADVFDPLDAGSTDKLSKLVYDQANALEQLQKQKTEMHVLDESKQEFKPPYEFLSDPCLAFAFKTLTGDMPVEAAVDCVLPSTADTNIRNEKNIVETVEKASRKKTKINSSKSKSRKECNLPLRYSKRLSGDVPQVEVHSVSNQHKVSSEAETSLHVDLAVDNLVTPNQLKVVSDKVDGNHGSADVKDTSNEEQSDKSKGSHDLHAAAEMQPQKVEMVKNTSSNSKPKPFFAFADFWLDPCLEFAFKTLTGAMPVEKNFIRVDLHQEVYDTNAQGQACFRQQADLTYSHNDGSLAVINNPSTSPSEDTNLASSSGFQSQQPQFKGNKGRTKKLNSH